MIMQDFVRHPDPSTNFERRRVNSVFIPPSSSFYNQGNPLALVNQNNCSAMNRSYIDHQSRESLPQGLHNQSQLLPLPTAKSREGFIRRLKKAFSFGNNNSNSKNKTSETSTSNHLITTNNFDQIPSVPAIPYEDGTYLLPRKLSDGNFLNSSGLHLNANALMQRSFYLPQAPIPPPPPDAVSVQQSSAHYNTLGSSNQSSSSCSDNQRLTPDITNTTNASDSDASLSALANQSLMNFCLRPPPPRYWLLSGFGWYWGPITHQEAIDQLSVCRSATFLVRDSHNEWGKFTLSYKTKTGIVLHHRISFHKGRYSLVQGEDFSSLPDLIDHAVKCSKERGIYCLSRDSRVWQREGCPVTLLYPLDRFHEVQSLKYLCRLSVRQHISDLNYNLEVSRQASSVSYHHNSKPLLRSVSLDQNMAMNRSIVGPPPITTTTTTSADNSFAVAAQQMALRHSQSKHSRLSSWQAPPPPLPTTNHQGNVIVQHRKPVAHLRRFSRQ